MDYKILSDIAAACPSKTVFSKPVNGAAYKKTTIRKTDTGFNIERLTEKQAFHENTDAQRLADVLIGEAPSYTQINAWTENTEHIILISKKGNMTYKKKRSEAACKNTEHNRIKKYIIETNHKKSRGKMKIF